jgi:DNA polymerase-3 subunit delta
MARPMNEARPAQSGAPSPPAYYLWGPDGFRKREELARLAGELLPPGLAELNTDRVSAPTLAGGELAARARQVPVLSPRRLLIVRDANRLRAAQIEEVLAYLADPNPGAVLVFVDEEEDPQALRRRGFPKVAEALARHRGAVRECRSPTGGALERWMQERAARAAKRLSPEAVGALTELAGGTLAALAQEIEKLALFVGERAAIEADDVREIVGSGRMPAIRDLTDALRQGEAAQVLRAFDRLCREAVPLPYVLASLGRELEGSLRAGGDAAFPLDQAARALRALGRADEAIKGGAGSPRLALERALLEICRRP